MSSTKRRELRHLVCGTFVLDPPTAVLASRWKDQQRLGRKVNELGRAQGYATVAASYSHDLAAGGEALPVLRVIVEEAEPSGGQCKKSSSVAAATADDPFAQDFVRRVIEPAGRSVFGAPVTFRIGPLPS